MAVAHGEDHRVRVAQRVVGQEKSEVRKIDIDDRVPRSRQLSSEVQRPSRDQARFGWETGEEHPHDRIQRALAQCQAQVGREGR